MYSGPGSNVSEGELHTSRISITGASPSDAVQCHNKNTLFLERVLPLCREYSPHILSSTDWVQ